MTTRKRIPPDWQNRLPAPQAYYRQHLRKLGRASSTGWSQALCPFHDDHHPSLSVKLNDPRGQWICFAGCGHGDMVAFHMQLTGLSFKQAVLELIAWRTHA